MFVVAKELLGLPGLPATAKGMREALCRFSAGSPEFVRKRSGSKAFEYHVDCLPEKAREIVKQRHYSKVLEQSDCRSVAPVERKTDAVKVRAELEIMRKCPALLERKLGTLTDSQKVIADARITLVQEVFRLMNPQGVPGLKGLTRKDAVELISSRSAEGTLPERIQRAADVANARKGSSRHGISVRTLQGWVSDYQQTNTPGERQALLAPGKIKAKAVESYPWMAEFLRFYCTPKRPTVAMAYEDFEAEWAKHHGNNPVMMSTLPSVDTVRYALKKIPKAERERGRMTGSDYKSLLPFVRRDWSVMPVNGVWVGDGHGMKMEVINPATGKPFRPEITLVIDGCTRVVVGWSLGVSESQVAVGDALRHAVSQYGVPLIYYSDNGGGEKNKVFDADITGIFSRLEIEHPTGIPGNPQARGIIERLNQEIPRRAAMKFGSWVGKSGDRETQRKYRKQVDSAVNAIENGKALNEVQQAALCKVPTWEQLIEEIERQVERHNNRPHSSLPVRDNGQHWSPLAYRKHLIERDNIGIMFLTSAELHEMFRPEKICTARRGEIKLFKNIYFSTELASVEGEEVRVCFDIHDPHSVIVRRMDGSWICDAIWNGNKVDAFPKAYVDQLQEKRHKRRRQRLEQQIARVDEELRPAIEQKPEIDLSLFAVHRNIEEPEKVYLFESEFEDDLKKASNHQ
ncbi:Mu transposase C-terminal domain-containing protein [Yokenella regensburgei]|uniref:Mu transposase C-terminal domain-containing protein n=1 Tax=Yokenella regensburgei TaxID=158877 RepID=UPI0013756C52|nr:Mu transposase C-terminal domain-containing protein [Yokenella regensburgei]KAF1366658.1 putative transposase [Yokenella regensburgei]